MKVIQGKDKLYLGDFVYIKNGVAERYELRGRQLDEIFDFHIVTELLEDYVLVK